MNNRLVCTLLASVAVCATGCGTRPPQSPEATKKPSSGIFASALREQVETDVLQCPYGADPTGDCKSKNDTWIDVRGWDVLPIKPESNATNEQIAKHGVSQYIFQKVTTISETKFRLYSNCSSILPDQAPIQPKYTSLAVYDNLRSKIFEKVKGEVTSKVKGEIQRARIVGEFESNFSAAIANRLATGSESNALLVEGRLLDDPRRIPLAVRQECLRPGARVVTGVSGFIVLKSTSASQQGLASSIGSAINAAVAAVADLPGDEKNALINNSARFSSEVAYNLIRETGFTVTVDQKKFFPVWGEIREVACQDLKSNGKTTTSQSVSLASATVPQKIEALFKLEGSCSNGATKATDTEDTVTCTLSVAGDLEATMKVCSLRQIVEPKR